MKTEKVVEQICGDPVVDTLDFGFGDVQHKQLGDSRQWTEAFVFILHHGCFLYL